MKNQCLRLHFLFSLMLVLSCTSEKNKSLSEADVMKGTDSVSIGISEEVMSGIIESIPAPLEMSALLKQSGAEFNDELLLSHTAGDNLESNGKKALALGMFGADLAYIGIYEQSSKSFNYIAAIKKLADDLNVGSYFDFNTLKRLSNNQSNIDSLIYVSTSNFNNMDAHLRLQKRSNLSVLMVGGAWIEGLYLATQISKYSHNEEIKSRIGEQKIILDNLVLISEAIHNDPVVSDFHTKLRSLKPLFDQIIIKTIYKEPVSKEVNNQLVIEDRSETTILLTWELLNQITEKTEAVRKVL